MELQEDTESQIVPTSMRGRSKVISKLARHFKKPAPPAPSEVPRSLTDPSSLSKPRHPLLRPLMRKLPPTFHKFVDLPKELRLQIWEAALIPRVHELHPCAKLYNERMTFRSNSSQTPAIFHTNRESRAVALKNYELMSYDPPRSIGKGILRFYFSPELDTLFLNSLMGLFIMFMLLEDEEYYVGVGVMKGWQKVAFDAERAQLISLLSGIAGNAPQPRFKAVFPNLKELIIAFDYDRKGKTRFRTSVWPGENGTSLSELSLSRILDSAAGLTYQEPPPDADEEEELAEELDQSNLSESERAILETNTTIVDTIFKPMKEFLDSDYKEEKQGIPEIHLAWVKRRRFLRGDVRYAFRKSCSFFGLRPRGAFRRL